MSYVSGGILYVTDTVGGGSGVPGNFYGTSFSDVVVLSGGDYENSYGSVAPGASIVVSSGGKFDSNLSISSGGSIELKSGSLIGYSSSTLTLLSGGSLIVGAGTQQYTGAHYILSGGTISAYGNLALTSWTSAGGTIIVESGAVTSTSPSFSGATVVVSSGGVLSGGDFSSGASLILENAAILSGTINVTQSATVSGGTIGSGAIENITTSASTTNQIVANGGVLNILGGKTSNVTLDGGQIYLHNNLATAYTTFTSNGGTLHFESSYIGTQTWNLNNNAHALVSSGASLPNTTVSSTAVLDVLNGGTVTSTTVLSGGSINIASGGVIGSLLTVSSGGTAVMNGTAGSGTVNLAGDGAHLVISGTTMPTNTISGWSPSDTIELASIPAASVTSVTTTSAGITIYTNDGTYSLNVPGANSYGYELQLDSNGGLVYTTCFAEGTSLMTPDGEAAVETLAPGTLVMTPKGAMPVKWLGHRSITVASQRVPEENWLVRIREGALADGVPARDLLVTQEHCMVFEGKLIPARMLVNGTSILIDRTINSYTYYHVELDSHEAVWAENALTESYLDTGNRDQFDNHTVTALFGGSRKAGSSASLPLETSRAFVEPIHAAIAARATGVVLQSELTTDPDLHLVTNFGQIIRPLRTALDRVMFMIPGNVSTVRLVSRNSRPSDTIGPFVDDRRDLGVLVGAVSLFAARQTTNLTTHLSAADLSGWHGLESSVYRWTDGNAVLPLQGHSSLSKDPSVLSIQIVSSGPYLVEAPVAQAELCQAG